jgi:plasmid stability protein
VANLTIVIDERLLKRARIRALDEGTSVNALLREYLERYAGSGGADQALTSFASLARRSAATSGPGGRTWTRDGLHDRTTP